MRRPIRCSSLIALGLAALAASCVGAAAESRLFSVRTTQTNLTIVRAQLDGRDLPVAGQNGNATFFRIDNPLGAVPCLNRFHFIASDGTSVDSAIDLCASNFSLTVSTVGAGGIQPLPPRLPAPVALPSVGQPIAITTDDRDVTINDVFIAAQPVPIALRADPYVEVFLPAAASGGQCSRDLGLALSDGRRIARQVDVCQSNFVVVVPVSGSGFQPQLPSSLNITRQPPSFAPPQPVPVAPPQPLAPPMQWLFSAPGGTATLSYGVAGAENGPFSAVCAAHTGSATVTLGATASEVRPGKYVTVSLGAGATNRTYSGVGSARSETDGLSRPVVSVPLSDPIWAAIITERSLAIAVAAGPSAIISLSGSAPQVNQFLALCAVRPAQYGPNPGFPPAPYPGQNPLIGAPLPGGDGPPLPPGTIGGGRPIDFSCDDGSEIAVSFAGNTVTVEEPGRPPETLFQAPSQQGTRYVSGRMQLVGDGENIYWRRGGGDTATCSSR